MTAAGVTARSARWIAAAAAASVLLSTYLLVRDTPGERSHGADVFSRSALGHSALARLLQDSGRKVLIHRSFHPVAPEEDAIHLLLDPLGDDASHRLVVRALETHHRVLVALPKWVATDHDGGGWVDEVDRAPKRGAADVLDVFDAIDFDLDVDVTSYGSLTRSLWTVGGMREFSLRDAQFVSGDALEPLASGDGGLLAGRLITDDDREIVVLADPDILANHGLHRADHAAFVLDLIDGFGEGVIVFDETVHGYRDDRSLWSAATTFPLSLVLWNAVLAALVATWAGLVRFGAPTPPSPRLGTGRRVLLDNTAALLVHAGHMPYLVRRAFERAVRVVASAAHGGAEVPHDERIAAADRLSAARGVRRTAAWLNERLLDIERSDARPSERAARLFGLARRIHDWKHEALHGPDDAARLR